MVDKKINMTKTQYIILGNRKEISGTNTTNDAVSSLGIYVGHTCNNTQCYKLYWIKIYIFHLLPGIRVKAKELKVMGLRCPHKKVAPFKSCHGHLHHDLIKIFVCFLKTKRPIFIFRKIDAVIQRVYRTLDLKESIWGCNRWALNFLSGLAANHGD